MSHMKLCFKCMGRMCLCALVSSCMLSHKCAVKFVIPIPDLDYKTKVLCSQTTPFRQTTIAQQLCSNAKGCSRQNPAVSEKAHGSF